MARLIPADVQAVVFDAVGTILFPDPPVSRIYREIAQQFGSSPPDADHFRRHFRRCFIEEEERDRAHDWQTSEQWEIDRWRRIVIGCLSDVTDAEAAFQALFAHFALPEAWTLPDDFGPVCDGLAARGLRLGLGSNYDSRLHSVIAGHPHLQRLDPVIISSQVGYRKPSGRFFASLVHALGMPPRSILFVGDDVQNDFEGARAAGLQVILLDGEGRHPEITPRIRRLADLLE